MRSRRPRALPDGRPVARPPRRRRGEGRRQAQEGRRPSRSVVRASSRCRRRPQRAAWCRGLQPPTNAIAAAIGAAGEWVIDPNAGGDAARRTAASRCRLQGCRAACSRTRRRPTPSPPPSARRDRVESLGGARSALPARAGRRSRRQAVKRRTPARCRPSPAPSSSRRACG